MMRPGCRKARTEVEHVKPIVDRIMADYDARSRANCATCEGTGETDGSRCTCARGLALAEMDRADAAAARSEGAA
jgi:hypothetical protein